jgi:hypothetical protein
LTLEEAKTARDALVPDLINRTGWSSAVRFWESKISIQEVFVGPFVDVRELNKEAARHLKFPGGYDAEEEESD